jgi:multicomponent Na+:H+ antiporter subunit D
VIQPHLPVLLVVAPLIAAALCVALRHPLLCWLLALTVAWGALAGALALLLQVLDAGAVSYAIGDWEPPFGIEYRVDELNGFVLVLVAAIAAAVAPFAAASAAREIEQGRIYLFYAVFLLALAGALGIAVTGDAFNLFVFLEISSLSSYALVSLGRDRRALTAAYRYLVMGTVGATFYVIGLGLIYAMTGTLNMIDLAARVPAVAETTTVRAALAFVTVGLSLKLALFPLHLWLPNAYTFAPSIVSVFLAATGTKVAVYALIRVYFTVFGSVRVFEMLPVREFVVALAVVGILAASAAAIFQSNVKRMLAYSSVAQISYMVLGVSFATQTGLTGGIVHLFNHALMKGALFMAMGCVLHRLGSVQLGDLDGLGRRMPLTVAAFVVGGLSLIGVPLTVGFVSKWILVQAALESGWWPVAVFILVGSLLAVVYVWRVVEVAYFRAPRDGAAAVVAEAPASMLAPLWLLAGASLYFGVDATRTVAVAERAAEALLTGLP